jgi:two-component system response regulator GlrR
MDNTTNHDDELPPLTEAKRRASLAFENRYLLRVMDLAKGSVSEGARLSGLDRTNFRRLLHRHGIDPVAFKAAAQLEAEQSVVAPKNKVAFNVEPLRLVRQAAS